MTTLMRNGRDRRLGRPAYGPREARTREIGWDPIRGLHQGQRPLWLHRDEASLRAKTGRIHGCTRTLRKKSDLLLQRGHRPYMALSVISRQRSKRSLSGGGFNRSTQHPSTLSGTLETYANGRACTDVGHAEAKGKALRALEEQPMSGRRRPIARETRAVAKILALNGAIAPAPRLECSNE